MSKPCKIYHKLRTLYLKFSICPDNGKQHNQMSPQNAPKLTVPFWRGRRRPKDYTLSSYCCPLNFALSPNQFCKQNQTQNVLLSFPETTTAGTQNSNLKYLHPFVYVYVRLFAGFKSLSCYFATRAFLGRFLILDFHYLIPNSS